jgi:predicted nucleic acid-binding protein
MRAKIFGDTRVLIYAHDAGVGAKHERAKAVLRGLWRRRTGVLSTRVLPELHVNVTRKIATPLPAPSARAVVDSYTVWRIDTTPDEMPPLSASRMRPASVFGTRRRLRRRAKPATAYE